MMQQIEPITSVPHRFDVDAFLVKRSDDRAVLGSRNYCTGSR
jgi:hypothetical protein